LVVISASAVGAGRGRQAAEQRRQREHQDPGDEHAAPAEDVAGAAAEQQQAAEGQGVGVEHPRQAGGGEAQRLLDLRQGDVDDGGVQHDHQLRRRDDGERQRGVLAAARRPWVLGALDVGDRHRLLPPLE
jgi:hypothetical protein